MGEKEDIFDDELRSLMEDAKEQVPKRVWSELSERLVAEGLQEAKPVVIPLWARWSAVSVAVAAALVLGVFLFMRGGESPIEEPLIAEVINEEGVSNAENWEVIESGNADEVSNAENDEIIRDDNAGDNGVSNHETIVTGSADDVNQSDGEPSSDGNGERGGVASTARSANALAANGSDTSEKEVGALETSDALAANGSSNEVSESEAEVDSESTLSQQIADSPKYIAEADTQHWADPFAEGVSTNSQNKVHTALTVSGNAFGNANTSSSSSNGIRRQMASSIDGQPMAGITEKTDSNYGIPATFGVGVKILFTPRWSLGVGVNYSLLSRTFSGEYTSYNAATSSYSTENYSDIRHRVDYIGIPVNAYFSIIKSHAVDFYVYAGGTIEKAVSSRYIIDHSLPTYKESVKGVQCSADIGVGVEFIPINWLGIYIDPSLRYYFPNSHQPKSIRTQEPLNFGFEIGLRFRL